MLRIYWNILVLTYFKVIGRKPNVGWTVNKTVMVKQREIFSSFPPCSFSSSLRPPEVFDPFHFDLFPLLFKNFDFNELQGSCPSQQQADVTPWA